MDILMKLALGPLTELFDFVTAAQHWKAAKQTRLHFYADRTTFGGWE